MIKVKNTSVDGWEAAIRGMRNPMNSWDKSDSNRCPLTGDFVVGTNDYILMRSLVKAGPDHSKFMRMINVTCDITAPLYWWKEFDTYKVGTVRNSCSTMHKILSKEFVIEDFSHEHLDYDSDRLLDELVDVLNDYRELYFDPEADENHRKDYWWQIIQLLPSSYNQKATVQLNYAVLRNMYHSRKYHKLNEWRDFCKWMGTLPYSGLILISNKEEEHHDIA